MELSDKTAREMYEALKAGTRRPPFGFGKRAAMINIDLQQAYTQVGMFATAYETDPAQMDHVNTLAALCRALKFPVIWTYCAYLESGEDCGIWGTRTNTPDSLQNIKFGSDRAKLDPRLKIADSDIVIAKRMASAFFETMVPSLMTFHKIDTIIITGGSTSGCVRATAVDSLSRSFRTIIPEECVADKHESPHFANLYDLAVKYADVVPTADVESWLISQQTNQPETA
jgi:maleamate amidohydrolase